MTKQSLTVLIVLVNVMRRWPAQWVQPSFGASQQTNIKISWDSGTLQLEYMITCAYIHNGYSLANGQFWPHYSSLYIIDILWTSTNIYKHTFSVGTQTNSVPKAHDILMFVSKKTPNNAVMPLSTIALIVLVVHPTEDQSSIWTISKIEHCSNSFADYHQNLTGLGSL